MLSITNQLLLWYEAHKRSLPWRRSKDAYKVWISEIILQQTRVNQGIPYYLRFIKRFPNLSRLARASENDVLQVWQGLGYYSRARNLYKCAKIIHKNFKSFPVSYAELLQLPGIGSYTAAAIASIAAQEPVPAVDGNVFRVLARLFGMKDDISASKTKHVFFEKAKQLMGNAPPDIFNQALMEFGALQCVPKPNCSACPFTHSCQAFIHEEQGMLPVKTKKTKTIIRHFNYFIIHKKNKRLLAKRTAKDIWQGLYHYYLIETKKDTSLATLLRTQKSLKNLTIRKKNEKKSETISHALSHQKLKIKFIEADAPAFWKKPKGWNWYSEKEIQKLPKPAVKLMINVDR